MKPVTMEVRSTQGGGPGTYDAGAKFGENVKSFEIGQKREQKLQVSAGPGQYSPENADRVTKDRVSSFSIPPVQP
jgi:hypothetical protein